MRLSILTLLLTATALAAAQAQMNSMTVTSDKIEGTIMENSQVAPIPSTGYLTRDQKKADAAKTEEETKAAADAEQKEKADNTKDDLKPLPAAKLTPAKDLKPWSSDGKLFTARGNADRIKRALADFTAEPGKVGPRGLFEVAELYRQAGDMPRAARYYYAAQLRARFDFYRWPGTRSTDEKNAYYEMSQTAATMGSTIGAWATSNSQRLSTALDDARNWDAATAYDYHPGFDPPVYDEEKNDKIPKEDAWPKLLDKSRDEFFREATGIAGALKALGQ